MRDPVPQPIRLEDYTPPAFLVPAIELDFALFEDEARVQARLAVERNPRSTEREAPLALDCEELEVEAIALDGRKLGQERCTIEPERVVVHGVPERFTLETTSRLFPRRNTQLMGLYAAASGFFTQCEAEGFRRITPFIDRPDVLSRYTVTIHADRERCPVLLSNGNLVAQGEEADGRHFARWHDPHPKPCYLFALVAAKLDTLEDEFVTRSGRKVRLAIYVDPGKTRQCEFAMQALKRAMRWDERVFGLEVDLDRYSIVAVGDFNMGAMENKGLNVFNTRYVLAQPETATDADFLNVERVIAHEYFHNWTGNRVTCRDWFQLSLKEGLTVFREQQYAADLYSRAVERIRDVRDLRASQFPEDAGPMAHPVRPAAYFEISNFYTATVYEKGAEVVRMLHTLLGPEKFRRGMDLYFARHDGQAVTCDDFVRAMADAAGENLDQFMRWYDQAGTPVVEARGEYDPVKRRYVLELRQSCPPTPGQEKKLPFHIPLALGLVGPDGRDLPLKLAGETAAGATTRVLSLKKEAERFVFEDVAAEPVPSLARDFSAPVIVRYAYGEATLLHLMTHDSDPFNRWEAGQRIALDVLLAAAKRIQAGEAVVEAPPALVRAFARELERADADPAFAAEALALPSEAYIGEQMAVIDPDAIHAARTGLRRALAGALKEAWLDAYRRLEVHGPYVFDPASAAKRALRNLALGYLMTLETADVRALCYEQFAAAANMTDAIAALAALAHCDCPERRAALEAFYARWRDEPLVVDKWFAVQASSHLPSTLAEVKRLARHPAFNLRNPNKVYALIGAFRANQVRFHAADGSGYDFLAEQILALDPINPQVAARLARGFDRWRKFDADRQAHARRALERIRSANGLSRDTLEIVTRTLA